MNIIYCQSVIDSICFILILFVFIFLFSLVMIGIIQPIVDGLPGIRLYAFGTNNKFTAVDTKNRMDHVIQQLQSVGIKVLVLATDGDSRAMKLMRICSQLGVQLST